MKARLTAVLVTAATITLVGTGVALAEADGHPVASQRNVLIMEALEAADNSTADCSTIKWVARGDSPIDTNSRALVVNVCADEYADAYTGASLVIDKAASEVQNLSWDERSNTPGAGAPRISVIFANGDVAYLASSTCSNPIAVSSTWNRADFTGEKRAGLCSFSVTGATGGTYTSDGTKSAWDAYVTAHPDQAVSYTFMVWDEVGHYVQDRISLGTDRLYNYGPQRVVDCNGSEARC